MNIKYIVTAACTCCLMLSIATPLKAECFPLIKRILAGDLLPFRNCGFRLPLVERILFGDIKQVDDAQIEDDNSDDVPEPISAAALNNAHNRIRLEHNLKPILINSDLSKSANQYASTMASARRFSHDRSWLASDRAENICWHSRNDLSADDVAMIWYRSNSHRRTLLGRYSQVGFGIAIANGRSYYVARYSR